MSSVGTGRGDRTQQWKQIQGQKHKRDAQPPETSPSPGDLLLPAAAFLLPPQASHLGKKGQIYPAIIYYMPACGKS